MVTNAFDAIAGGKAGVAWYNPFSTLGNPNDLGANSMLGQGQLEIGAQGNIFTLAQASGSPAGSGAEYVVGVTSIAGGSFDLAQRGINIWAAGVFATGGVNRVQVVFNPSAAVSGSLITRGANAVTIADTGQTGTLGAWALAASVFKYGNPGSNTQIGLHQQTQVLGTVFPLISPVALTANEAGPILIAVTAIASTAANTTLNFFQVEACN